MTHDSFIQQKEIPRKKKNRGDGPHKPLAFDQILVHLFLLFVFNLTNKILFKPKKPVAVARPSSLLLGVPRSTRPPHYLEKIYDHENIATTNHPLPLIPVEQLSADGERIFTQHWLNASGRPFQQQCC